MPSYGRVLGKGDAMWRALSVLDGDLVCFLDADTEEFTAHFATGLLGPLVCESDVSFVKAFYRRPLKRGIAADANGRDPAATGGDSAINGEDSAISSDSAGVAATEGARVTRLTAGPALELFYPQLAGVRQPLAGEVAARRVLLERLPFTTGYGVEIGMLVDGWNEVGLDRMAQVDLEEHRHGHQPLSALTPMALAVLATIAARLQREGRLTAPARAESASEA